MDLEIAAPRSEEYSEYAERVRSKARSRADEGGQVVRSELGDRMFDLLTEYFPEEYAARRREELVRAFSAGIAVGVLGRELVRYARR